MCAKKELSHWIPALCDSIVELQACMILDRLSDWQTDNSTYVQHLIRQAYYTDTFQNRSVACRLSFS